MIFFCDSLLVSIQQIEGRGGREGGREEEEEEELRGKIDTNQGGREGGRAAVLCVRLLRFLFHSCSLCVSVTANQQ